MPLIYSALILIIGTIAIAILVFTFVVIGNCADAPLPTLTSRIREEGSSAKLNLSPYSASSFKFKKGVEATDQEPMECVVCLLGFEDDEEIRKLHGCNHSFHAPCIDMWMYSHSNCPICRTPVDRRAAFDFASDDDDNSSIVFTDISASSS
ncbi:hypothetical protein PTKIN_Ptkin18bG0076400 [Pterospermum kingtungense]